MTTNRTAFRRRFLAAALLACTLVGPVAVAEAKVRVKVLGWTTQGGATSPQVKNGETVDACLDVGDGQRSLRVIFRGRGIAKNTKVGVGLWGSPPNAGFAEEPTDAEVIKNAFKWPVGKKQTSIQPYGFSWPKGPFGPRDINGEWQVKITVKQKVVARGSVTIACSS